MKRNKKKREINPVIFKILKLRTWDFITKLPPGLIKIFKGIIAVEKSGEFDNCFIYNLIISQHSYHFLSTFYFKWLKEQFEHICKTGKFCSGTGVSNKSIAGSRDTTIFENLIAEFV